MVLRKITDYEWCMEIEDLLYNQGGVGVLLITDPLCSEESEDWCNQLMDIDVDIPLFVIAQGESSVIDEEFNVGISNDVPIIIIFNGGGYDDFVLFDRCFGLTPYIINQIEEM